MPLLNFTDIVSYEFWLKTLFFQCDNKSAQRCGLMPLGTGDG